MRSIARLFAMLAVVASADRAVAREHAPADRPQQMTEPLDRMLRAHPAARGLVRGFFASPPRGSRRQQRYRRDIELVLSKVFGGNREPPRVVRLHEQSRGPFNVPAGVSSRYGTFDPGYEKLVAAEHGTRNDDAAVEFQSARADVSRLGTRWIMLADDRPAIDIWSDFVHEASHLRFHEYLRDRLPRLSERFPSYIRQRPGGRYAVDGNLIDLLHEWYAFEMGYRAFDNSYGRQVASANSDGPAGYGRGLEDEKRRHAWLQDVLFDAYRIRDRRLRRLVAGRSLSEVLKYGEHGSRAALERYRAVVRGEGSLLDHLSVVLRRAFGGVVPARWFR